MMAAYNKSKLCNVLFANTLAEKTDATGEWEIANDTGFYKCSLLLIQSFVVFCFLILFAWKLLGLLYLPFLCYLSLHRARRHVQQPPPRYHQHQHPQRRAIHSQGLFLTCPRQPHRQGKQVPRGASTAARVLWVCCCWSVFGYARPKVTMSWTYYSSLFSFLHSLFPSLNFFPSCCPSSLHVFLSRFRTRPPAPRPPSTWRCRRTWRASPAATSKSAR